MRRCGSPPSGCRAAVLLADHRQGVRRRRFADRQQRPWITGTGNTASPKGDGNADSYVGTDGVHPTRRGPRLHRPADGARRWSRSPRTRPPFDTTAPTGPTAVNATVAGPSVQLSWDAATDDVAVTGYDVYRGTTASFVPADATKIAHVTGTSTTDSGVPAGQLLLQGGRLRRQRQSGSPATSSQVTVVAPDTQAPSVAGWRHDVGHRLGRRGELERLDRRHLGERLRPLPGHLRRLHAGCLDQAGHGRPAPPKTDAGVLGGTWYYKVIAFDAAGNRSDASDAASAVVVPPAPVTTTVTDSADTYVNAGAKTTNYGTSASAIVDGSPVQQTLLRFALPATPTGQQLTSAVLRVRTTTQAIASAANELEVRLAGRRLGRVDGDLQHQAGCRHGRPGQSRERRRQLVVRHPARPGRAAEPDRRQRQPGDRDGRRRQRAVPHPRDGSSVQPAPADPDVLVRIAQVINLVDERGSYGGPLRVALNQVDELRRRGHDVTLLGGGRGYPGAGGRRPSRAPTSRCSRRHGAVPGAGFAGSFAPGVAVHLARRAARAARRAGTTWCTSTSGGTSPPCRPPRPRWRAGTPYVVQTHGMIDASSRALARPLDALMTRRVLAGAAEVLLLTDRDEADVAHVMSGPEVAPASAAQWRCCGGGSTRRSGCPRAVRPEVLYLGRLHDRKRPLAFVEIGRRAHELGLAADFVLVGADEGELPAVRAAIDRLPPGARVRYEGPLPMAQSAEPAGPGERPGAALRRGHLPDGAAGGDVGRRSGCLHAVLRSGGRTSSARGRAWWYRTATATRRRTRWSALLSRTPFRRERMGQAGRELVSSRFSIAAIGEQLEAIYAARRQRRLHRNRHGAVRA